MKKNEFFFKSKDNETNIHMVIWEPDGTINAIVQVVHGELEHMGMYEEFAEYYTRGGILVVGIDLIGHGFSTNNETRKMVLNREGAYEDLVSDIDTCVEYVKGLHVGVPYVLMGISFGSVLVRNYLIKYPKKIDGSILIGECDVNNMKLNLLERQVRKEIKKYGDISASLKYKKIINRWNKKIKNNNTSYDWMNKSNEMINKYINDQLRGVDVTNCYFREMILALRNIQGIDKIKNMDTNKPILIMAGKEDVSTNYGKDARKLCDKFKKCNIYEVMVKIMEDNRHDIMHDDNRYKVYDYIYGWISQKIYRGIAARRDEVLVDGVENAQEQQDKYLRAVREKQAKEKYKE